MKPLIDILLISLFCNGWYLITHGNMLLDPIRLKMIHFIGGIERADGGVQWPLLNWKFKILKFIYKPLFGCIICYSSIWGTVIYWVLNPASSESFIMWPVECIICSYTNLFLYNLLLKLES